MLDDEFTNVKTNIINAQYQEDFAEKQFLAFQEYFKAIDLIENENLTKADFMELENNRINFKRELDL